MVTEVDVLQHGHSSDFCGSTCKQSACLLCIIAYHHELVVKLRENGFDSLPENACKPTKDFSNSFGSSDTGLQA